MNCPACGKPMTTQNFGGVIVDVCSDGCKGLWFDWLELKKLDESNEGMGDALKAALDSPRSNPASRPPLTCPKCKIPMHVHKYKSNKEVTVDECYNCGAFFLDSGELRHIRDHFMTEQEESTYLDRLIATKPDSTFTNAQKDLDRTQALKNMTRVLSKGYHPSR